MTGSDRDLGAKARNGDLRAFDELVWRHQARVYALARRILGDADDAADVQQDTFVRAWRSLRKFRLESEFRTWLHRIAVNLCLTRKRRRKPALDVPFDDDIRWEGEASAEPSVVVCLEKAEIAVRVRRVMWAMPLHYRVLLVLREVEGRPFGEIARILGCSEQSARVRAAKARQMLRERIQPYLGDG